MKYAIIHIADIHYRKEEPEGVSTVLKEFINDIKGEIQKFQEYKFYIAMTGDIVQAGKDNDAYENFTNEINKELNNIGLSKDFRMIVPGNHDLDRNIVKQDIGKYQKEIYNNIETEPQFNGYIKNNNSQSEKFENYELFESEFSKFGLDFSTQGKGWNIDNNLSVYCLNSALCSFGGAEKIKDKGKLAIYTRGLVEWCNQNKTTSNILLMHHPINHLTEWSQKELKQIIEDNFSLCLCGHAHKQDILYNNISQKALICSAPQLFTNKEDSLGYAIIHIEENEIEKIVYRQYSQSGFLNGLNFTGNNEGIIDIQNDYLKNKEKFKLSLTNALTFFKGQPVDFILPKLSENREFDDEDNLLDQMIKEPKSAIIISQPQFGLTCLALYMRLQAYRINNLWIYIDAEHTKARKVINEIEDQLQVVNKKIENIKCIIIDSWDNCSIDHRNILKCIDDNYDNIPIIIMSNYAEYNFYSEFDFSTLKNDFTTLHLQALQRGKVRELVSKYNKVNNIAGEDEIVTKVVKDLEILNVHRTPLNCLTLLKVFENDFNKNLINRTKMIKAVLFILFTDSDSFTYASNKPDIDDCEYILGKFCSVLITKNKSRRFSAHELLVQLTKYSEEKLIRVNISTLINILESNKILIRFNDELEFKHTFWIYYFAATYMIKDKEFEQYILKNKTYVNFPEIIEFYTGIDGIRKNAIQTLLNDTNELIDTVSEKIGILEEFNPFEGFVWNPSEDSIETIRKNISEKVQKSNLPAKIKDIHADKSYDPDAPYDQSINNFLHEYAVSSLIQSIKASSRALRNSNYIDTNIKREMLQSIMNGWEQISKVMFWVSPTLARRGSAIFDGLRITLCEGFDGSYPEKLKAIFLANPDNVVSIFKDDISSQKIGPLLFESMENNSSEIQRHFISLFLLQEKPDGWHKELFEHMNILHKNSFYLGNLSIRLKTEIKYGFNSSKELSDLKDLNAIVVAKHPSKRINSKHKTKTIPKNLTMNKKNKLPIDKIRAAGKPSIKRFG